MQSKLSDIELIEQTLAGDQSAFTELVKRHQRFVFTSGYAFCKRKGRRRRNSAGLFYKSIPVIGIVSGAVEV